MKRALKLSDLEPYRDLGIAAAEKGLGMNSRTIHRHAHRLGFEFSTIKASRLRREFRQAMAPVVIILAELGITQRRIGEYIGAGRMVVRHIAEDCGIRFSRT